MKVWLVLRDSPAVDGDCVYTETGLPDEGEIIVVTRGDRHAICARVTEVSPEAEYPIRAVETDCPDPEVA